MSENNQQTNQEEVDLGQLFKIIGKAINSVIGFFVSIFKFIFSTFIGFSRVIINNWKIIAAVIFIGFVGGKLLEIQSSTIYSSKMMVKPYFESKYQLISNIDYYNSLLKNEDYKQLSNIFSVEEDRIQKLKNFEIKPGPESENDRLLKFNEFKKQLDSLTASTITLETFVENRSLYNGSIYEITVESLDNRIFRNLEPGLNSNFKNNYSEKIRNRRDSIVEIERRNLNKSLQEIKTLQKVYIDILEDESKNPKDKGVKLGEGFSISTDDEKTREYDLLNRELEIRNKLQELDKSVAVEDEFFDIISSFQEVGTPTDSWEQKYGYIFPAVGLIFLLLLFLLMSFVKFVNKYED
ncbi:hypothetical protein [Winogradskyella jejuensis]|uniref:Uncharacterized protein n=1 Tax=Winogradskyella jejuensis TaxID=1089305 RepID=A0A1M5MV03_9FLAO|nr:hypothetical protein [Winogradskyella jejuensis]SHG81045.1 hypothetical protein SAMN05444148_1003 [Winogradskyella jejuensis]